MMSGLRKGPLGGSRGFCCGGLGYVSFCTGFSGVVSSFCRSSGTWGKGSGFLGGTAEICCGWSKCSREKCDWTVCSRSCSTRTPCGRISDNRSSGIRR